MVLLLIHDMLKNLPGELLFLNTELLLLKIMFSRLHTVQKEVYGQAKQFNNILRQFRELSLQVWEELLFNFTTQLQGFIPFLTFLTMLMHLYLNKDLED